MRKALLEFIYKSWQMYLALEAQVYIHINNAVCIEMCQNCIFSTFNLGRNRSHNLF